MKSLRLFDRRVGFSLGALSILMGMVAPAVLPTFASAAQISSRSIAMSDSTADASGVSYTLTFTPATDATDMLIYFCDNSPLSGAACSASSGLVGLSLTGASVNSGSLDTTSNDAANPGGTNGNVMAVTGLTLTHNVPKTIVISGVHNPTAANTTFYARVETFGSEANQKAVYGSTTGGAVNGDLVTTNMLDNGGIALSTTNQIGVSAQVLETLTFCTYGDPGNTTVSGGQYTVGTNDSATYLSGLSDGSNGPKGDCTNTNSNNGTAITLGQQAATGVLALSATQDSYGYGWTGISTNANGGAIVYMKNNTPCDGLALNSTSNCAIPGVNAGSNGTGLSSMSNGTAAYGVTFGGGSTPGAFDAPTSSTATGTVNIDPNYAGKWAFPTSGAGTSSLGDGSLDVDSTYGGVVYDTNNQPIVDKDVPFGIGAGIDASTAAGRYNNNLSLIAVGTF